MPPRIYIRYNIIYNIYIYIYIIYNKSVDKLTSVKTVPLENNEISRPNTYAKAETSSKPKSRDTSDVLS